MKKAIPGLEKYPGRSRGTGDGSFIGKRLKRLLRGRTLRVYAGPEPPARDGAPEKPSPSGKGRDLPGMREVYAGPVRNGDRRRPRMEALYAAPARPMPGRAPSGRVCPACGCACTDAAEKCPSCGADLPDSPRLTEI